MNEDKQMKKLIDLNKNIRQIVVWVVNVHSKNQDGTL